MAGMSERMGLTDAEVDWLRSNMNTNTTADRLVRQYQMIIACPSDPGARAIFEAMRDDWRKERQRRAEEDRRDAQAEHIDLECQSMGRW